jgi:uncharacterized protein YbaR (Trm112 family)
LKKYKIFQCPECARKFLKAELILKNKKLICLKCKAFYPFYKGLPVLLRTKDDIYHLKKALLPAKYRVEKYED